MKLLKRHLAIALAVASALLGMVSVGFAEDKKISNCQRRQTPTREPSMACGAP